MIMGTFKPSNDFLLSCLEGLLIGAPIRGGIVFDGIWGPTIRGGIWELGMGAIPAMEPTAGIPTPLFRMFHGISCYVFEFRG